MTDIVTNEGSEESPSWLKQRSSVFNANTAVNKPKVVDKELARLKNIGAVSSVWSNKFVQEDGPGVRRQSYTLSKSPSPTSERFNHARTSTSSVNRRSTTDSQTSESEETNPDPSQVKSLQAQYDQSQALLAKANKEIEYYKDQIAAASEATRKAEDEGQAEAASLWFQCETLKTQFARIEARLKKANAEIESYKAELEAKDAVDAEHVAHIRQLAELVVKQDSLIQEYETNLDHFAELSKNPSLGDNEDIKGLHLELAQLKQQKVLMEGTISSLRADLETRHGQMNLIMAVSLEIQNEFQSYKEKREIEINSILEVKEAEHLKELLALEQKYKCLTAGGTSRDIPSSTDAAVWESQIADLKKALDARDRVISDMELQLKNQKQATDAQIMELTESILEKDALLIELQQKQAAPPQEKERNQKGLTIQNPSLPKDKALSHEIATDLFHPAEEVSTPKIQMSQVREFMYSSSSDDEDDRSEVLMLSYSSDEEDKSQNQDRQAYFQHLNNYESHEETFHDFADAVSSPVSSTISFNSSRESSTSLSDRHFSFSTAHSQPTRSGSLNSVSDSFRSSTSTVNPARFSLAKDSANWPMPPPTPPPSEPLPPVPSNTAAPTKRARSRTMARDEAPDTSIYTTSIHQTNELPRIIPLQRQGSLNGGLKDQDQPSVTNWMDDPESEEDDLWREPQREALAL